MSQERERRASQVERRSEIVPSQRETSRTERLDASAPNPHWRPPRAGGRGSVITTNSIWHDLPRWLQVRGWIYLLAFFALIVVMFMLTLSLLRGDRREAPLGEPQPTAITQPTSESTPLLGNEGANAAPQPAPPPSPRFFVVVNTGGQGLFLRPQPNRTNPPIATLPDGTRLEQIGDDVPGEDRLWRPVRTPDGLEGYVAVDFLAPDQ
ncbi:SH3 domain-containing protein [Chloroflexus sp.]|uniref:SH3 domain-containing protein n=1 Tax=Chloroflexus sp. TaxID=1904827 RepID=UPI002ACE5B5E|nr:SH3 domain-containing protein [Chloroflexus sp.]